MVRHESTAEALLAAMADVRAVHKQEKNTHQGFYFRGVDAVVNATAPAFRKHGVVVTPRLESVDYVQHAGGKNAITDARVVVTYRFQHVGCEPLEASVAAEARDYADKATAKAMSVAFRIALLQSLCLPTEDVDPDSDYVTVPGDQATHGPVDQAQQARDALLQECNRLGLNPGKVKAFGITPVGGSFDLSVVEGAKGAALIRGLMEKITSDPDLVEKLRG